MAAERSGGSDSQHYQIQSLSRQGSLYNLTLNEVQNHIGEPLLSMNLDDLLKTVFATEANQLSGAEVDMPADQHGPTSGLLRQGSIAMSCELSKKTVDEVWRDIQQEQKNVGVQRLGRDKQPTLGEMTLEDFLVKAGVVADTLVKDGQELMVDVDPMGNTVPLPDTQNFTRGTAWLQPFQQMATMDKQMHGQQSPLGRGKSMSSEHLMMPEHVFTLSEKPTCTFRGHTADVLDVSWSKSQYLISSSMDKTVRLWHVSDSSCLKIFTHTDYVTCIQFNPIDDQYFISGSLDKKARIWHIPDRQIVAWNDLHEMVTAACFAPNGQTAIVGTHKGSCHLFDTSENKLNIKSQIFLQAKKRRSSQKKITGFEFVPGSSSEVLITSADSRICAVNGVDLIHKFKGFRNTSSQISASMAANGKYVICASEDSHVYMWRYDAHSQSQPSKRKGVVDSTMSYEHFHCQDVTVAVALPDPSRASSGSSIGHSNPQIYQSLVHQLVLPNSSSFRDLDTWPEENSSNNDPFPQNNSSELCNGTFQPQSRSARGMVIVTAGRRGEIKIYQNYGFPQCVSRHSIY